MNREEKKQIYRQCCTEGKIRDLFMQAWWLDATGEWDVALAWRNDQLVGAMPYTASRQWGIRKIGMPSLTHHLGIWMDKPPDISAHKWLTREKQIIWLLIDDLPKYGFFSMVFTADSFNNWLPFHWKGFRQEMRYTFCIDRSEYDALDQHLSRNLKRNLKEAEGSVSITRDIELAEFYSICTTTYRRQRMRIPFSFERLQAIDRAVQENKSGLKLGARDQNGNLVAVSYLLWDEQRAYYFLAGDNEAGRDSGASILLCREAIRIAFEEQKVEVFDFCGSMIEPITDMRRQFGARAEGLMKIFKSRWKLVEMLYSIR